MIEYRFLPKDMKLPAMIDICGDKTILSSVEEESCILIQNIIITEMMKFMFNMIWRSLEGKNLLKPEQVDIGRDIQL